MSRLTTRLERLRSPGYQYAWSSADAILELVVGGVARLPDEPMTARATLNAYSVAKTLTAAAVLQLAARGALDLDAPLGSYLDISLPYTQRPTVRQTLLHRGGLPNPLPLSWAHLVTEHAEFDQTACLVSVLRAHPKLKTAPGQSSAYTNLGYWLLGEAVRHVTGQDFARFVEEQLIEPLGLAEGAVLGFSIPDLRHHAHGHLPRFGLLNLLIGIVLDRRRFMGRATGRWVEIRDHYANGAAYGGLIANALGLVGYLQALLSNDRWLAPDVRRQLLAPVRTAAGTELGRTLGWFQGQLRGHRYLAHAGGGAGYYCEARLYPEIGRASVVMLNRVGLSDARILDSIDKDLLPDSDGRPTD